MKVPPAKRTGSYAVGLTGTASEGAPPTPHGRSTKSVRVQALLKVAGFHLPVSPLFILKMGRPGGFSAEEIMAAHAAHCKACDDGGGCMAGLHGGNSKTGRTAEQHAKAGDDGGGCMLGQHGGNSVKGRTAEQHAKACGGRASLHEDAINILFANWNALPLTWKARESQKSVKRNQSYTATQACELRMIHHVLSFHYNEKVGKLQTQSKVHVTDRYNEHFKYEAGDPGFIV